MKYSLSFILFLYPFLVVVAQQDISLAIKQINPPLFMNNMMGEKIYTQKFSAVNCSFTRDFDQRNTEHIQETYLYRYLCPKRRHYILEIKLDKRRVVSPRTDSVAFSPIEYSDFGVKVYTYQKRKKKWHLATLETLPNDFTHKIISTFPQLQKGGGLYFYNLDMQQLVQIKYKKKAIQLTQNQKPVLQLVWKRNGFEWK